MDVPTLDRLPSGNPLVNAIHTAVKGRARYKVNGLYGEPDVKRYLELKLSKETGIAQVSANHYTGNVLVFFDPKFSPDAIALLIERIILNYGNIPQAIAPQKPKQKQVEPAKTELAAVSGTVSGLAVGAALLHVYDLDKPILLAIQKIHTPLLDRIMVGITLFGEPEVLLLNCLALGSGLVYYNRHREAATLGIAAVGAVGLNYWLKTLFGRSRPALWNWIVDVGHFSFPSGHAMVSMVIYGFMGYLLAKQFPLERRRIAVLTVALITAIGFSRLYLGVHWPTDVAVGYALGLVWLAACIVGLELWEQSGLSFKYLPVGA